MNPPSFRNMSVHSVPFKAFDVGAFKAAGVLEILSDRDTGVGDVASACSRDHRHKPEEEESGVQVAMTRNSRHP